VSIICGNALESDLSTATAVFLYLLPKGMSRLLQKLQAERQPGCKVITYMFRYRCTVLQISLPSICKSACLSATLCKLESRLSDAARMQTCCSIGRLRLAGSLTGSHTIRSLKAFHQITHQGWMYLLYPSCICTVYHNIEG